MMFLRKILWMLMNFYRSITNLPRIIDLQELPTTQQTFSRQNFFCVENKKPFSYMRVFSVLPSELAKRKFRRSINSSEHFFAYIHTKAVLMLLMKSDMKNWIKLFSFAHFFLFCVRVFVCWYRTVAQLLPLQPIGTFQNEIFCGHITFIVQLFLLLDCVV
jgi:hypothetical protein